MTESAIASIVPIGLALAVPEVVAELEALLERAKTGELRSLVWVAEIQDESHDHGLVGCRTTIPLLGQLTRLTHRIQVDADEAMRVITQEGG